MAIRDAEGKAIRMLGAHTNVTALKGLVPQGQQAAFFSAIDTAPIARIVTTDSGQLLHLNEPALELFGYTKQAAATISIYDLFDESFASRYNDLLKVGKRNTGTQTRSKQQLTQAKTQAGASFQTEVGITLSQLADNRIAVCSVTDLTPTIALNTQLKRSNDELANFAYIASHDLQGPLRRVTGFLDLLKSHYGDTLGDEASDWIGRSVANLQRMQSLITSLLSMSQIQSKPGKREIVNVSNVIHELVGSLQEELEKTGTTVLIDNDLPNVEGDPSQLTELFSNLIYNGIKYGRGDQRKIEIGYLRQQSVSAETRGDYKNPHHQSGFHTLFAKDNGIGIHKDSHDKVFEMFQRLHSYGAQPGNGIGLAICKRIIEAHGGKIWLESEENVGSSFYFNLPVVGALTAKKEKMTQP